MKCDQNVNKVSYKCPKKRLKNVIAGPKRRHDPFKKFGKLSPEKIPFLISVPSYLKRKNSELYFHVDTLIHIRRGYFFSPIRNL